MPHPKFNIQYPASHISYDFLSLINMQLTLLSKERTCMFHLYMLFYHHHCFHLLSFQHLLPPTDVSHQVTTNASPSFTSSEMPTFQWLHQEDPLTRLNHSEFGISMPLAAEMNGSVQSDIASSDNLVIDFCWWISPDFHVNFICGWC